MCMCVKRVSRKERMSCARYFLDQCEVKGSEEQDTCVSERTVCVGKQVDRERLLDCSRQCSTKGVRGRFIGRSD